MYTSKIPYLHFEKHQDFKVMSSEIAAAMDAIARRPLPRHRNTGPVAADDQKSQVGSNAEKQNPGDGSEDGEDKPKRNVLSSDILHKLLIQSYLKVGDDGDEVPPLQVRRTLDHYFYSHLGSTSRRDDDQVVLRYTSNFEGVEPKIFMVDQLWIWILEDGKRLWLYSSSSSATSLTELSECRHRHQLLPTALELLDFGWLN